MGQDFDHGMLVLQSAAPSSPVFVILVLAGPSGPNQGKDKKNTKHHTDVKTGNKLIDAGVITSEVVMLIDALL